MGDGPLSPTKISPSRVGTLADCGKKFEFKYVQGLTPDRTGSALLFGKVMHNAREHWVVDHNLSMRKLVERAWIEETRDDTIVAAFLKQYQKISAECVTEEMRIREAWAAKGKESKAPRRTKEFAESAAGCSLSRLLGRWLPRLERSKYEFKASDPLPALYDESLRLADDYQEREQAKPHSYIAELAFDFTWEDWNLIGYIDDIRPLMDKDSGEFLGIGVVDAKTYKTPPELAAKDARQLTIYKLAVEFLAEHGMIDFYPPGARIYCGIDRMRLGDYVWYELGEADVRRLRGELRQYTRAVEHEVYIPASKTCNSGFCDFRRQCEFWHGNAGAPVELNV